MADVEDVLYAKQDRIDRLHRCRAGRTALVVIDMQRGFLEPGAALEVPQGREIIPNIRRLVELCRNKAIPVVHTQFVYATAIPCLRGDPFGPEHLPAVPVPQSDSGILRATAWSAPVRPRMRTRPRSSPNWHPGPANW